jgi:hypothetical protein
MSFYNQFGKNTALIFQIFEEHINDVIVILGKLVFDVLLYCSNHFG